MKSRLPKVIAAHDLSGLGKASLGAVIPILSTMGTYVCSLPTAVLSTITGVFEEFTMTDLTGQMIQTIDHWSKLDISFDALYSGFLGSPRQVDVILDAAKRFGCPLMADPVFADHGALYPTMTSEMVESMRRLVHHACLITPNMTEAQFLLDEKKPPADLAELHEWLERLADMGPKQVVITSCELENAMYVCLYDGTQGRMVDMACDYLPVSFHGTGDIFTSVLVGATVSGIAFEEGVRMAADFVKEAISRTIALDIPPREGVAIELALELLR